MRVYEFSYRGVPLVTKYVVSEVMRAAHLGYAFTSFDLGRSFVKVEVRNNALVLGGYEYDLSMLSKYVDNETSVYGLINGKVIKIAFYADGKYYKLRLVNPYTAPTLEINGVHMHRIKGITPWEDAKQKVKKATVRKGMKVLDIGTGLLRSEVLRPRRVAVYARVSGSTQRDDLERQLRALREWVRKTYGDVDVVEVTDIGSGVNTKRRGLWKLVEMARRRQVDAVVVAYKDRLTRFGFEYLEELFKAYGVKVVVAFQEEPRDYMQELVEDLVAIVTSFAVRIYGRRSKKYKKVVKAVEDAVKDP